MKKWNILGGMTAAVVAAVLMAVPVCAQETTLPEGIYVGDISVGGMTEAEAEKAVQAYVERMAVRKIVLEVDTETVDTTAQELGFAWINTDAVAEAAGYAAGGNLIQKYMALKDLQKDPVHIPLEMAVDETLVDTFIREQCVDLPGEPKNATITRENGEFVITSGEAGVVVDVAATRQSLNEALTSADVDAVTVKASVTVAEPEINEEDLATIGDVLGTFSTDFSSSGAARSKNLQVGSSKMNGHVLMPGETLSGYECMHPFTTENGYYTAAAYENGQVVDSVGGGVCQIATTLYNAALRAELEITQRQNHSMVVGYVKPSMDAAIAGTYKDIKITNNYSTPIYVEGGTSGRTLSFTIYGKETRPSNRKVTFESKTLDVTDPGAPTERLDPTMAPGTRKQVQSAHRGLKSQLWKVVTVDGVETERTLLNSDTYIASKAIVLVGPAVPETQPAETQSAQGGQTETAAALVEGTEGGPGAAAAPSGETQAVSGPGAVSAPEEDTAPTTETAAVSAPNPTPAPDPASAPGPAPAADPAEAPTAAVAPGSETEPGA